MIGIYTIINKIDSKIYIGSSMSIESRLKGHINNLKNNRHRNEHLQSAVNKYGIENFKFESLIECSLDCLESEEQLWMNLTNCTNRKFGYNKDVLAYNSGHKMSDETKEKLRIKAKGRIVSRDVVEKIRLKNLGQIRSNHSINMKNRWDKSKLYFGLCNLSKDKLDVVKQKISISMSKRFSLDENISELVNSNYLKCVTENEILYFRSLHKASEYFNVDRGGIKYAIKNNNGKFMKIKCVFINISRTEYLKNKTSGEK